LCKKFISSNEYGPLFEKFIKDKLKISKAVDKSSGDGCKNDRNIEIKVSLGDKHGQLNMVQIRPSHNIHYYLFMGYNLLDGELGKVHTLLIPSKKLYALLPKYGSYAHGTIKSNGKITKKSLKNKNNYEYALRPNPIKDNRYKSKKLWKTLLNYSVEFEEKMFSKELKSIKIS
jgi:hypothetical protein